METPVIIYQVLYIYGGVYDSCEFYTCEQAMHEALDYWAKDHGFKNYREYITEDHDCDDDVYWLSLTVTMENQNNITLAEGGY